MAFGWAKTLWALLLLATFAQAQFQFFEQMFGGGHTQQQGPQNAASDSSRYQKLWKESMLFQPFDATATTRSFERRTKEENEN